MSKPKVLIELLTTYERTGWVCQELAQWLWSLPFEQNYVTCVGWAHNFSPAAAARNYFCSHIKTMPKEERPDWILMIDNDMVPAGNLLTCIDKAPEDAGVVIPRFYMWNNEKGCPVLCWGVADAVLSPEGTETLNVEPGKYYPLTKGGTGAMFIRPAMLDEMEPPFFYYTYNADGSRTSTEDINFCISEVPKTKWKIYGCADVEIGHYHNVDLAKLASHVFKRASAKEVSEPLVPAECFR